MKKIFTIIVFLLFINNVYAFDIETRLTQTKKNIIELENKVTSFEDGMLNKTYPVGSIFKTTAYSNVNEVQNAIGGTWEVYASGRALVGVNASDSIFNSAGKTSGVSTTTLTTSNIPSHTHSVPKLSGTAASAGGHSHTGNVYYGQSGYGTTIPSYAHYLVFPGSLDYTGTSTLSNKNMFRSNSVYTSTTGAHTHSVTTKANTTGSSGSTTAFTNLQPYITVYMYKRIA